MMDQDISQQLNQILVQSRIILSAIQVGDMDIVEHAVDERDLLIKQLETVEHKLIDDAARQLYKEFQDIEMKCQKEMDQLKYKLEKELFESKNEMQTVQKSKNAMDKYHMQSRELYSGLSIDNKK